MVAGIDSLMIVSSSFTAQLGFLPNRFLEDRFLTSTLTTSSSPAVIECVSCRLTLSLRRLTTAARQLKKKGKSIIPAITISRLTSRRIEPNMTKPITSR